MNASSHPAAPIVTRFAPSPTGELHIGGARTALFAWAYARGRGGRFLLRLEDTDQKRSTEQSARNIERDLRWIGLDWDNDGAVPRQSQRLPLYDQAVAELLTAGKAYEDQGAVRFRVDHDIFVQDAVFGEVAVKAADIEDFVIRKADGFPTFHLAVVIDDAEMGVTHVIRGQEHLSNTPKHVALQQALGLPTPIFAHLPSILNPGGSKMSKRDKAKAARQAAVDAKLTSLGAEEERFQAFLAKSNDDGDLALAIAEKLQLALPEIEVSDFRRSGYLPAVLNNYIALLGWNPGGDVERFENAFLCERFDFDRVGKSNSTFDREKLGAFSQATLGAMPQDTFAEVLRHHLQAFHPEKLARLGESGFATFAAAYQPRSKTLNDPILQGHFFFEAPRAYDEKAASKNLLKGENAGLQELAATRTALAELTPFTAEAIHARLEALVTERGLKNMGGLAQPLRVALTGTAVSPEIGPTLALLGRDEVLARIDACLQHFAAG